MQFNATKCDVCGTIKGPSNHWYRIAATGNPEGKLDKLILGDIGKSEQDWADQVYDLCGQSCLVKQVAYLMGFSNNGVRPIITAADTEAAAAVAKDAARDVSEMGGRE